MEKKVHKKLIESLELQRKWHKKLRTCRVCQIRRILKEQMKKDIGKVEKCQNRCLECDYCLETIAYSFNEEIHARFTFGDDYFDEYQPAVEAMNVSRLKFSESN